MNIIVLTSDGKVVTRPDTTLVHDNGDFFVPDYVTVMAASPIAYFKVVKPGKCISPEFAGRYVGKAGLGVLLYPCEYNGVPISLAEASCLDHTTYIREPVLSAEEFSHSPLSLSGGFEFGTPSVERFHKALELVSSRIYLRSGDVVCLELCCPETLHFGGCIRITGRTGDAVEVDFRIIG
ncbi:MAG: hypothetical protein MJY44_05185 [Bacteroidales bacterium]|nr:hypothetical protein [Bacteroidales bacterium]